MPTMPTARYAGSARRCPRRLRKGRERASPIKASVKANGSGITSAATTLYDTPAVSGRNTVAEPPGAPVMSSVNRALPPVGSLHHRARPGRVE